jgi:hypothetical protein
VFSLIYGSSSGDAHPHPAVSRAIARGYELEAEWQGEDNPAGTLTARAKVGPLVVAAVTFADRPGAGGLVRTGVWVADGHTGQGLSTALHVLAEAKAGKPIADFWGDDDRPDEAVRGPGDHAP